jgi:hypothetical protein
MSLQPGAQTDLPARIVAVLRDQPIIDQLFRRVRVDDLLRLRGCDRFTLLLRPLAAVFDGPLLLRVV